MPFIKYVYPAGSIETIGSTVIIATVANLPNAGVKSRESFVRVIVQLYVSLAGPTEGSVMHSDGKFAPIIKRSELHDRVSFSLCPNIITSTGVSAIHSTSKDRVVDNPYQLVIRNEYVTF